MAFVTLHVGLDTFRPMRVQNPHDHQIHGEYFDIGEETVEAVKRAKHHGHKVVAVGTTSVRCLEQAAKWSQSKNILEYGQSVGWADLLILPGHRFKVVDAIITNFHLPRSSTLMMASAFAGRERLMSAYAEAIAERYRFYSFGDAMLII